MDLNVTQFSPNVPGHKGLSVNPWAIPYAGYMHIITASHNKATNVLYVHIGCPVLLTDSVREGESVWDAIRRVVFAWQAAEREADHAMALDMIAAETLTYREMGEDECYGCSGIGECFCGEMSTEPYDTDYDMSDYYGAESDLYDIRY